MIMTRINCIPVQELCTQHLVAEYRELPRIFNAARDGDDLPDTYRMGAGHVKFFYNKLKFLINRYFDICDEMKRRDITVNFPAADLFAKHEKTKRNLWNDWTPKPQDMEVNRARIADRLKTMKRPPVFYPEI
jgi:deoxyribonuclease (pyrimidine dimer)